MAFGPTTSVRASPLDGPIVIRPRSVWGDGLPPTGPLIAEDVRFLLVHHTAGRTDYAESEVVDQMRQVYRFHTGPEKGWPDVAYNFFVDRYGGVWEGRQGSLDGPIVADATGGSQGFAQLVCLLGNFHEHAPTPEMMGALVGLLALLADRYDIATEPGSTVTFTSRGSNLWPAGTDVVAPTIAGHRDMSQTVCPGDFVYPLLHVDVPASVTTLRSPPQFLPETTPTEPPVPATSTPPTSADQTTTTTTNPTTTTTAPTTTQPDPVAATTTSPPPSSTVAQEQSGSSGWGAGETGAAIALGGAAAGAAAIVGLRRSRRASDGQSGADRPEPPGD
nr:N-acetylmuramoyl-L-alanine amidase [Ilumatobacter fluminis]